MKRIKILFTIILLTASLISCSKKNEIELKPNFTQVSGDLESYITVVDGTYKVENVSSDLILMIKLKIEKKIDAGKVFEEINAQIIDDRGMPLTGIGKFFIAKGLWASGDDNTKVEQALLKGSGEVIVQLRYSDFGSSNKEEALKSIIDKGKKFSINTKAKVGENTNSTTDNNGLPGLYPFASTKLLSASDIENYSKSDLKIMRNEIFARHGFIFKTDDMKNYFSNQSWYKPQANEVSNKLTDFEKKNIELIKAREPYAPDVSNVNNNTTNYDSPEGSENDNSVKNSSSSDCDQFIKDYEAFADSYIKILKKYKKNPSDMTILNEYTECMQKATTMQTKAKNCNDSKYVTKLMNIANKIASALQ